MFRQLAVVAVLACAVLAAPIENFDDIPNEYKALIPAEVAEHLKSVTAEEKAVLKDLAKQHKDFKNEDEFLAALKEKSPSLHEKAVKLHAFIKTKVEKLGDDAQKFVKEVLEDGRAIHREYLAGNKPSLDDLKAKAKKHIEAYQKLSPESKAEFKEHFPILSGLAQNEQIKTLAEKYLQA